ncbi:MAG: DNA repair protein RadA, partial [Legionella sp.]
MKVKTQFTCSQCAAHFKQWAGQCVQCGAWNSIIEEQAVVENRNTRSGQWANQRSAITAVADVVMDKEVRLDC